MFKPYVEQREGDKRFGYIADLKELKVHQVNCDPSGMRLVLCHGPEDLQMRVEVLAPGAPMPPDVGAVTGILNSRSAVLANMGSGEHLPAAPTACAQCGTVAPNLKLCVRCLRVRYCNGACQKLHWRTHKRECKAEAAAGRA
jgi:hypothetical protein